MELMELMKRIELFRGLDDGQLNRLASISQQATYQDDESILGLDNPGSSMFILGQGQVEIQRRMDTGQVVPALYLGEGQVFGEMALLEGSTRSANVVAARDNTVVYRINRDDFLQLCQQDTGLGYLVMRNLAQDLSFKLRHRNLSDE
jgi:CRP-like cAMP-binding protein